MNDRKFCADKTTSTMKARRVASTVSSLASGSKASKSSCDIHSMLPSARDRVNNRHDFFKNYFLQCKLNNTVPRLKDNPSKYLEFFSDRIRSEDWMPIIRAIACDQSLKSVRILNYNLIKPGVMRQPSINKVKLLSELMDGLSKMIPANKVIESLELQCLRLDIRHITLLAEALKSNNAIYKLGLAHCNVGDEGCRILCNTLRYHTLVNELDLSKCDLTEKGADYIAQTIKVQTIFRHAECWERSLRYRQPNINVINGLKTINLDDNIQLQDSGFIILMNVIIDDIWIKEISCKNCGLTNLAAQKAIEVVQKSRLSVLDIRRNLEIDSEYVEIVENILKPKLHYQPPRSSPETYSFDEHMLVNGFAKQEGCWYDQNNLQFPVNQQRRRPVNVPNLRLPGTKRVQSRRNARQKLEITDALVMNDCYSITDESRSQRNQFVIVEKGLFEAMISSFKQLVDSFNEAKLAGLDLLTGDNSDSSGQHTIYSSTEHFNSDKVPSAVTSDTNAVYIDVCDGFPTEDIKYPSLSDYDSSHISINNKTTAQSVNLNGGCKDSKKLYKDLSE